MHLASWWGSLGFFSVFFGELLGFSLSFFTICQETLGLVESSKDKSTFRLTRPLVPFGTLPWPLVPVFSVHARVPF